MGASPDNRPNKCNARLIIVWQGRTEALTLHRHVVGISTFLMLQFSSGPGQSCCRRQYPVTSFSWNHNFIESVWMHSKAELKLAWHDLLRIGASTHAGCAYVPFVAFLAMSATASLKDAKERRTPACK